VSWWTGTADTAPPNDPRVTEVLTTIEPSGANLVSKQAFGYSQDLHNNQTDIYEYDYGAGAAPAYAMRHTQTDFLAVNPANGVNYADPSNGTSYAYNDVHLRSLPKETRVYAVNPANGAESLLSRARYDYDQTALTGYSGVVGLCPTFDGAGQCLGSDPAGYTTRGNNTGITKYADAANEATAVTAHMGYDVAGNAISATDPLGRVSQVNYSDSFADGVARNTYAFPTSTTSAVPDPTNQRATNTPLTSSTVYDYSTGHVTSSTDANAKTTTAQYADALDRLTRVDQPDGGRTTYTYVDQHQCGPYVETRTLLDSSGREIDDFQFFDGLGRGYLAESNDPGDASNPWRRVDTQYDALGRVWRVSNPYRSTGCTSALNPSGRWTTSGYDALGRVTSVTMPDGAMVISSYVGNQVTVTDQAGKARRSVSDALGRLRQVVEDPAGLAYQTNYDYDALGNLRQVVQDQPPNAQYPQGVQQRRYFMYDSLSRLIRAKNPEQAAGSVASNLTDPVTGNAQWSMAYGYDAGGNLTARVDARNVTTTYTYDNLNRATITDYSDGTAEHIFTYDFAANGRGRLYYSYDTGATGGIDYVPSYDAMGRPTRREAAFYVQGSGFVANYATTRTYDLSGNVATQVYPSGHTVLYSYDAAGRLSSFTGNIGDGASRTYSLGITYDEAGRMSREQFGTQTPLYHKSFYNIRGQLFDTRLSSVNDTWDWNRGRLINYYAAGHQWGQSGPDNNGNVVSVENWIPPDNATLDQADTLIEDKYTYDALNRLSSVSEQMMGTANGWTWAQQFAQGYSYDRYGNRQIDAGATWGSGINNKQFSIDTATNRLGVPSGQTGAMSYDPAGNLTYDNYTDPGKSVGARSYDAENRMTTAQAYSALSGTYTEQYVYDAEGHRARRKLESGETWQVSGFGGELLAEYASGASPASPQKEYGYRGGELLITAEASGGSQQGAQSVTWQNAVGVTASPGSLTKTAGSGWNTGGASSVQSIQSGDGYVEFTATLQSDDVLCGLSHGDTNQDYADIDFAIYASHYNSNTVFIEENGVNKGSFGTFAAGDKFRVSVEGGAVKYYRVTDGTPTLLYTSTATPSYPLLADTSLYWTGDQMTNVVLSAGAAGSSARTNVALASQGATASASFYDPDNTFCAGTHTRPSDAIDGVRAMSEVSCGTGYWRAHPLPSQWLEVDFSGQKSISEIDVYTTRDNYTNQSAPTASETFSLYGASAYDLQYWDGAAWAAIPGAGVTGNNHVWRSFVFAPVTTAKIRLNVTAGADGVARVTEVEAYTPGDASTRLSTFVTSFYRSILDRQPTSAELSSQVSTLTTAMGQGQTAFFNAASSLGQSLFLSQEYANRNRSDHWFVYDLYEAFAGREPDSGGWAAWEAGVPSQGRPANIYGFSSSGNGEWVARANAQYTSAVAAQAQGGGGVNWLVSDHLGTPRMVVDQTGSLSGIKRHDYLPFGEELTQGQGGRTTAQGYAADQVRQKFTGYERDSETGLDYAHARYYASTQGRFAGVDPLPSSADVADPQTWNRYSYGANNPLSNTDPTGMFIVMKSPFDGMAPESPAGQGDRPHPQAAPPLPPPAQSPPQPTGPVGPTGPVPIPATMPLVDSGPDPLPPGVAPVPTSVQMDLAPTQTYNGEPIVDAFGQVVVDVAYGFARNATYTVLDQGGNPMTESSMKVHEDVVKTGGNIPLAGKQKDTQTVDGKFGDTLGLWVPSLPPIPSGGIWEAKQTLTVTTSTGSYVVAENKLVYNTTTKTVNVSPITKKP
jgi:RHS repeat-associated protein